MDYLRLLEFQIDRLGYQFKNVDLLQEALTHSIDPEEIVLELPNQNRPLDRLQIIGNAVIKFAISQYVIQSSKSDGPIGKEDGELLAIKLEQLTYEVSVNLKKVGEMFFEPYTTPEFENLFNYLRICKELRMKGMIPYQKVIRALMGAVYLDAGGASGGGLEEAFKLFERIWREDLGNGDEVIDVQDMFPPPPSRVLELWKENGIDDEFVKKIEKLIGVKIADNHLLIQALIHKTFYSKGKGDGPNFERLKILGDSVLGLVVTEFIWFQMESVLDPKDYLRSGALDIKIESLISAEAQNKIFTKLGLNKFVKARKGGVPGWRSKKEDILESIVGAVFVDGGGILVKDFIMKAWGLQETLNEPNLEDLQDKLGYRFQNTDFLILALSHPSGTLNGQYRIKNEGVAVKFRKLREILTYFGTSWIQFHATDYVLRTSHPNDSVAALVFRRSNLCGENILLRIGSHLNLSKYVGLSTGTLNRGMEPYMLYQDVVETIAGAIFKDMQEAKIKMNFGQIFYRLWNPFFQKCPNEDLIKSFPSRLVPLVGGAKTKYAIGDSEFDLFQVNIVDKIHYFKKPHLLDDAVLPVPLGMIRNNPGKLLLLGEAILDLAVRVYATIDRYGVLKDQESVPKGSDFYSVHSRILEKCLEEACAKYKAGRYMGYLCGESGLMPKAGDGKDSDEELIKRLFGAVFVDMWEKNADMTFAEWKNYIILRCKFFD